MKPYKRSERLKEEIQRVIAEAIRFETRDPRLENVTILRVELSDDLKFAKIFFSAFDDNERALEGLKRAKGFLRSILAKKLRVKFIPDITFEIAEELPELKESEEE
jgi:ribosome-binding factor A